MLDVPLPEPLLAQLTARPLVVALYNESLVAEVYGVAEAARVELTDSDGGVGDDSAAADDLFENFARALAAQVCTYVCVCVCVYR